MRTLQAGLYDSLRRDILDGKVAAGSRLPSTRTLAAERRLARNTVAAAYDRLLAEGYLETRRGAGTFVASELPERALAAPAVPRARRAPATPRLSAWARRLAADPPPVQPYAEGVRIDFRYGKPDVDHFPHVVWRRLLARSARPLARRSATVTRMGYAPSSEGSARLRAAIARHLQKARGVVCDAEQVIVTGGSQQALDLCARVLLDPGDRVIVEEPGYPGARRTFAAAGAKLLPLAVDRDGLPTASLPPARLAYVTPSHQYPAGAVLPLARRLALLEWARRHDAMVLEDDYDSEFRYDGRPIESMQGLDVSGRVVYAGTFSKVLFPALRTGFLVPPPTLVGVFRAAKWIADRTAPMLEQEVLTLFLEEGHFERHLRRARALNAARRAALLDAVERHFGDRAEVEGANAGVHLILWRNDLAATRLPAWIARARAAGVALYPITPYYLAKPPARAGLLVGYGALDEKKIDEGIRIVARL